jgi:glycosyltransferase involved in cell wall biosynthesis
VRNDVFFKAIPKVLRQLPEVRFDCPGMQGKPEAKRWVQKLGIEQQVNLMPHLSAQALADTLRAAQVLVSPSTHDGTPNSLLEGMACGVFPVCGDLESIREWIRDGENGLLVDPGDPDALSAAILNAFRNERLRERAAGINKQLITERANYPKSMERANAFYSDLA